MKNLLIFISLSVLLVSCAPDPRKQAQADQIRMEAEQAAADQKQARQQSADYHALDMKTKQETAQQWQNGVNKMFKVGFQVGTVSLSISLLALAVAFSYGSIGVGQAIARKALVQANLIQLDAKTRQFPLLVQHVHGSKYALHNPNTGSVLMLDTEKVADRQLIATSGATQIAGAIAQEARQSSDPAGLAVMQPPIVSAKDALIEVGADLWRQA